LNPRRRNIVLMVIACILFLALPFALSFRPAGESLSTFTLPILRDVITNALLLFTFLLNYYLFIPKLYFRKRYIFYGVTVLLAFLAICLLPSVVTGRLPWRPLNMLAMRPPPEIDHHSGPPVGKPTQMDHPGDFGRPPPRPGDQPFHGGPPDQNRPPDRNGPPDQYGPPDKNLPQDRVVVVSQPVSDTSAGRTTARISASEESNPVLYFIEEIRHSIYLFIAVILLSLLLRVRERMYSFQQDKVNAELSGLKAQINPHFLFNSLNSLYALSVKKDERMGDAIINLAGLMRYIIKDATEDKIPLQRELDYITNYIELQQSRIGDTAIVQFSKRGEAEQLEITPLILITFIENAFKHGVNPEERSEIDIAIDVHDSEITLKVTNNKVHNQSPEASMGIGLRNTQRRLDLLYADRHKLTIHENALVYMVHLSILLT
jgi:hypothetical protein